MDENVVHLAPLTPARMDDILRWKCSGADVMPNGRCLKQYRPNGVINVVRCEDSFANGICQNPEFTSNFVNTFAPVICANVWSTAGSKCFTANALIIKLTQLYSSYNLPNPVNSAGNSSL